MFTIKIDAAICPFISSEASWCSRDVLEPEIYRACWKKSLFFYHVVQIEQNGELECPINFYDDVLALNIW